MIQAVEKFKGKVELWLLGQWIYENFRKECEKLAGMKYTKYFGQLKVNEVYKYLKVADVGLNILHPAKNYVRGMYPTKVSEYFACSLPVIMSNIYNNKNIYNGNVTSIIFKF